MHVFLKEKIKAYTWDADKKNTEALIAELKVDRFSAIEYAYGEGKGALEISSDSSTIEIFPGEWVVVFPHGQMQYFNSEDFHTIFKGVSDK